MIHFIGRAKAGLATALVVVAALGCKPEGAPTSSSSSANANASAAPLVIPPIDAAAVQANAESAAGPHVFRYELVLTGPEPATTTKLFMEISDAAQASVSFGKNVMLAGGNRSDVGSNIKARVTMRGDTPLLEVDASIASPDAAGKVRRVPMKGSAATPVGTSTVVVDTAQDGSKYRLSATPSPAAVLGEVGGSGANSFVVDVVISQTGGNTKKTQLTLAIDGDAPAVAKHGENVPLTVNADGGVGTPRQDVGTRVKAVGHPRRIGLELDFDLELSTIEGGASPPAAIRKIVARSPVFAPFDKATTAFTAEESGHRYEVVVTPRRAK